MYSTSKRIIACILLFNQTLMSCSNFHLPGKTAIESIEKPRYQQYNDVHETINSPTHFSLFIDSNQILQFQYISGSWQSELIEGGITKQVLPIQWASGYSMEDLEKASLQEQQRMVHLIVS